MASPITQTALLVDELLGSTLSALVKAQGLIATQLADFVEKIGFEAVPDGDGGTTLRARTFSFEFDRSEVGDDDTIATRRVSATLPLLSIVSLPALTIETADIDLELRLVATDVATQQTHVSLPERDRPLKLWAIPWRPPISTATPTPTANSSASGAMRVQVTLRRMDVPLGLERLERLMADGYVERDEEG